MLKRRTNQKNNKLYESIMRDVSKVVKRHLNEMASWNEDIEFQIRLVNSEQIQICNPECVGYENYKNNVYIDGDQVELDDDGFTLDEFDPGQYTVCIKGVGNIKDGMTDMFYMNNNLIAVSIPDSVTEIGAYAFANCRKLRQVILSPHTTKIGFGSFENCTSLEYINIPNTIKIIDKYAFANCYKLNIEKNLKNAFKYAQIDPKAFDGLPYMH